MPSVLSQRSDGFAISRRSGCPSVKDEVGRRGKGEVILSEGKYKINNSDRDAQSMQSWKRGGRKSEQSRPTVVTLKKPLSTGNTG